MSSSKGNHGKITIKNEQNIEWKINNISSLRGKNDSYFSPEFKFSKVEWRFLIYPNGKEGPTGWISLYLLYLNKPSSGQGATFNFGVRKSDGNVDKRRANLNWIFDEEENVFGYSEFLPETELETRKTELAPSDNFTITCDLWKYKDFDSTARVNSLSNNLLDLYTSKKAADVTLHVKDKSFLAHKAILIARSPLFAIMFEVAMKEKASGIVDIKDCDPPAFEDFLKYLYSGKLQKLSTHVFELHKIAHLYEIEELKSACVVTMMNKLSVDTVCEAAVLAKTYDEAGLMSKVATFFNINYEEIFDTHQWEELLKYDHLLANILLKGMAKYWSNR